MPPRLDTQSNLACRCGRHDRRRRERRRPQTA